MLLVNHSISYMPKVTKKEKPLWGRAIAARRAMLGKSLVDIENETDGELYQALIYRLENGKKDPATLTVRQFSLLLKVLGWRTLDWQEQTGLEPLFDLESQTSLQPGERVSKLRFFIEPVRGLASAGLPVDADGMPVLADVWRRGSLLYQVEGDSMAPTLNDGDRVYVDPTELDLREGRVYVFEIPGNGHTIKRVRRLDDGELWLVSDNPKYRPWRPSEMRVIGRVYYHDPAGGRL